MNTQYVYHGILKKYVIMFGNMFKDIEIIRRDGTGNIVQAITVPISYSPKERFLVRMRDDPDLNKKVAIALPRLGFEIVSVTPDPSRNVNKMNRLTSMPSPTSVKTMMSPIPYNIGINLYGMFANMEDSLEVMEQIIPYFRPEWTTNMTLVPELNHSQDITTVLNGMDMVDTYDGSLDDESRRAIIHTYTFTVRGYMFGPISNAGGLIRKTIIDFTGALEGGPDTRIVLTPGLLANGSPTTNAELSVPLTSISANSDYEYAYTTTIYNDGVDRHNHG